MNLKHLTDKALLADTKYLAGKEREISLKILHHLKEIERRRLFSDLGYPSLLEYAVRELGYSEPAAARRISSARLLRDIPEIEKKIEEGVFSLTNLAMASQHFKNENIQDKDTKVEILRKIEGVTKRECEKVLLQIAPPTELPKETEKRVSASFHSIKMNWSEETMNLYTELKNHHAHKRYTQDLLMKCIFQIALKETEIKMSETTPAEEPCNTRHIPKNLKAYIHKRDKGKCQKCGTTYKLEFDHIIPFALGGKTTRDNLRLLCFSCNQRQRIKAKL